MNDNDEGAVEASVSVSVTVTREDGTTSYLTWDRPGAAYVTDDQFRALMESVGSVVLTPDPDDGAGVDHSNTFGGGA